MPDRPAITDSENSLPMNLELLRSISEGDTGTEKELVAIFVEESDANLKGLQENCRDGTHAQWVEFAHTMKGSASNMGADALSQLCKQAQHSEDSADVRSVYLRKIEKEYLMVKDYLKKLGLFA